MSDALDEALGSSVLETLETLDDQDPVELPSTSALQDALRTIQRVKESSKDHPSEKTWLDEQHSIVKAALVKAAANPVQLAQEQKICKTPAASAAPQAPSASPARIGLSELERLKAEAVAVEDYELAASLRNQIAALESSEAPTKRPEPGQKAARSAVHSTPLQSDLTTAAVGGVDSKPPELKDDQGDALIDELFDDEELAGALAAYRDEQAMLSSTLDEIDSEDSNDGAEAEHPKPLMHVCMSCPGSEATLADLEELCAWGGLEAHAGGCFGACDSGPNVSIVGPATAEQKYGTHDLHSFVSSLDKAKRLV